VEGRILLSVSRKKKHGKLVRGRRYSCLYSFSYGSGGRDGQRKCKRSSELEICVERREISFSCARSDDGAGGETGPVGLRDKSRRGYSSSTFTRSLYNQRPAALHALRNWRRRPRQGMGISPCEVRLERESHREGAEGGGGRGKGQNARIRRGAYDRELSKVEQLTKKEVVKPFRKKRNYVFGASSPLLS